MRYLYTKSLILFTLLSLYISSCLSQNLISQLSDSIYAQQKDQISNDTTSEILKLYRNKYDVLDQLNYSIIKDTIYILEMNGIQGNYVLSAWNKTDVVSCTNESNNFSLINKTKYPNYMTKIISNWDKDKIEQLANNSDLISPDMIYATRIIFHDKEYDIECIRFKKFLEPKIDSN